MSMSQNTDLLAVPNLHCLGGRSILVVCKDGEKTIQSCQ